MIHRNFLLLIVCCGGCLECANALGHVPDDVQLILAYGESRSASTFEFMATCVASVLKFGHAEPAKKVCCDYARVSSTEVNVVKTHSDHLREHFKQLTQQKAVVIMSRKGQENGEPFEAPPELDQVPVALEVDRVELEQKELFVLTDYSQAFDLSKQDSHTLREFMELWQVTRKCCGSQASSAWRHKLNTGNTTLWHECDMYNLGQVESMLLDSTFAKEFPKNVFFPDNHYPLWHEGFCERSIVALKEGLKFNEDYWLSTAEKYSHGC